MNLLQTFGRAGGANKERACHWLKSKYLIRIKIELNLSNEIDITEKYRFIFKMQIFKLQYLLTKRDSFAM